MVAHLQGEEELLLLNRGRFVLLLVKFLLVEALFWRDSRSILDTKKVQREKNVETENANLFLLYIISYLLILQFLFNYEL